MGSLIEERLCSLIILSHAISGNFEPHLAKTQRAGMLGWKDSLVDPESSTKPLDNRVWSLNFDSEVAAYDQWELVGFQQRRYKLSFAMAEKRRGVRSALDAGRVARKGKGWGRVFSLHSLLSARRPHKEKPLRSATRLQWAPQPSLECTCSEGHSSSNGEQTCCFCSWNFAYVQRTGRKFHLQPLKLLVPDKTTLYETQAL